MKKSKIVWLSICSFILCLGGYFVAKIYECGYSVFCYNLFSRVGDPLFYGMGALAIVFLILIFKSNTVSAWKKFARWYIPITTLIFIFYPNPGSGDLFSPYPEQIFQWLSIIYVAVSILIIFWNRNKITITN